MAGCCFLFRFYGTVYCLWKAYGCMVSGKSPPVPVAFGPFRFHMGTAVMCEESSGAGVAGAFRKKQLLYLSAAPAVLLWLRSACALRKSASADSSGLCGLHRVQSFDSSEYCNGCTAAEAMPPGICRGDPETAWCAEKRKRIVRSGTAGICRFALQSGVKYVMMESREIDSCPDSLNGYHKSSFKEA